jgi:hypothetical protein
MPRKRCALTALLDAADLASKMSRNFRLQSAGGITGWIDEGFSLDCDP